MATQGSIVQKLNNANEGSWLQLGTRHYIRRAPSFAKALDYANNLYLIFSGALWESLQDLDKAMFCFENALRHNPYNIKALTQVASICRMKEMYPKVMSMKII